MRMWHLHHHRHQLHHNSSSSSSSLSSSFKDTSNTFSQKTTIRDDDHPSITSTLYDASYRSKMTNNRSPNDVISIVAEEEDVVDKYNDENQAQTMNSSAKVSSHITCNRRGIDYEDTSRPEEIIRRDNGEHHHQDTHKIEKTTTFDEVYELGKKLGYGACASVFIGKHKLTGGTYAIKAVDRSKMHWNNRDTLQDEINNLMTLRRGPNIIQLYDVFEENKICYLVTELMMGGELFDQIVNRNQNFTEIEARNCCRRVLSALKYMHERRIVHRDLKPENLLLSDESNLLTVTVADFGFARALKEQNGCRTLCGTHRYIAPEVLERFPSYDVECDVWSFGVILFILLCGYFPFDDDDDLKIVDQIRRGKYVFHPSAWKNISNDAKDLVVRCLTLNPTKRINAMEALQHNWMVLDDNELDENKIDVAKLKHALAAEAQKKVRAAANAVMVANRLKQRKFHFNGNFNKNTKTKPTPMKQSNDDDSSTSGKSFHELYDIGEELDEGGYAKVYRCTQKGTKRTYAVKHVTMEKVDRQEYASLKEEISALKVLRGGPHIIRLHDVFNTDPDNTYIVLDECKGGQLLERITEKEVYTEREARHVCRILFQALDYCHKKQIAHRDIKPENILLMEKGDDTNVKIVDFGFAKKVIEKNSLNTICGTAYYIAPEIVDETVIGYDHRCDIWSAGIVTFLLLGGYVPFDGPMESIIHDIVKGDFVFHEEYWDPISTSAKEMIRSLLQVRPDERATAQQALSCDWMALEEESLSVKDLSTTQIQMKKLIENLKQNIQITVQVMRIANKWMSHAGVAKQGMNGTCKISRMLEEDTDKQVFNDIYECGSQIKNGTFSVIHKVTHRQTKESFVVKRVSRKDLHPVDAIALHDEISTLQLLKDCTYTIKLFDVYDEADYTFLVYEEYTRGGDLMDRIDMKKCYTEYDAKLLCRNLITGVVYCHEKKIAHRNLNLTNLLFSTECDDTNVKIGGFGYAKIVKFSDSLRTQCGTDGYVAPEILEHHPKYDVGCDMWSMGVILYIILCGYSPFYDNDEDTVIRQIRYGEYTFHRRYWKHISNEAKQLISSMLTVDPSKRITAKDASKSSWIQSNNYQKTKRTLDTK